MAKSKIKSFGECMRYTLEHQPNWIQRFDEDGNEVGGRKAAIVNCRHFIDMYGNKFPVDKIDRAKMLALRTRCIQEKVTRNQLGTGSFLLSTLFLTSATQQSSQIHHQVSNQKLSVCVSLNCKLSSLPWKRSTPWSHMHVMCITGMT